jgi:hypothetical protein
MSLSHSKYLRISAPFNIISAFPSNIKFRLSGAAQIVTTGRPTHAGPSIFSVDARIVIQFTWEWVSAESIDHFESQRMPEQWTIPMRSNTKMPAIQFQSMSSLSQEQRRRCPTHAWGRFFQSLRWLSWFEPSSRGEHPSARFTHPGKRQSVSR